MRLVLAALLLVGAAACGSSGRGGAASAGARADAATVAADAGVSIVVTIDGEEVARVDAATLRERRRLVDVLPERGRDRGKWREVTADGPGGRTAYVRDPPRLHADQEGWLYLDERGRASFGMFRDPAAVPASLAHLAHAPTVGLVDITAVDVRLGERAPAAEAPPPITVVGAAPITRDGLAATPTVPSPFKGTSGQPGWDLWAVVRARLGGRAPTAITLVGASADPVQLDAATLSRKDRLLHLRWNRRGEARVRLWSLGPDPKMLLEVNDLREIRPSR
jgi:hypothetical protein